MLSKPIPRVVISVLIALVLLIGIYTSVQGAILNAGTKSARAYVAASVNLGLRKDQNSAQKLDSSGAPAGVYDEAYNNKSEGDCHHDSAINPEDY